MIVKFFASKKGGGTASIDYLLDKRTQKGTARILQGDEKLTREIIKSMSQKHKACVGCLSFEEKNISEELKKELMRSFENMLLTPEMQGRYNILWVEHIDKERLELNFVIPKIDLESKKAFNPYFHMADMKKKDLWTDFVNLKHNLSNPKNPTKENTIQGSKKEKELIRDYESLDKILHDQVAQGLINSRKELISFLEFNSIEVTRQGKDYLGIKLPDSQKAKRFKGGIYNEQFTSFEQLAGIRRETESRARAFNQRDITAELAKLERELHERIQRKSEYYRERHKNTNHLQRGQYHQPIQREREKNTSRARENPRTSKGNTRELQPEHKSTEQRADEIQTHNNTLQLPMWDSINDNFLFDCVVSVDKTLSNLKRENNNDKERREVYTDERGGTHQTERQVVLSNPIAQGSQDDDIRSRAHSRNREITERNTRLSEQRGRTLQRFRESIQNARESLQLQQEFNTNSPERKRDIQREFTEARERIQTGTRELKSNSLAIRERIAGIREQVSKRFREFASAIKHRVSQVIEKRREKEREIQRHRQRDRGLSR